MNVEWHNHWALPENFTTPVPNPIPIPNPNPNPILTQSLTLILYQGGEILRERQHKVGILWTRVRKNTLAGAAYYPWHPHYHHLLHSALYPRSEKRVIFKISCPFAHLRNICHDVLNSVCHYAKH